MVNELFSSKVMTDDQVERSLELRNAFVRLAEIIDDRCSKGRYKSLVMTKLEEAAMFANKSITHDE